MTSFVPPPPRSDLLWSGIDLDGTLAESLWSPDNPHAQIGDPIWSRVEKALELYDRGRKLWIHTARPSSDYQQIEEWCGLLGLPIKGIITGKPLFSEYIDDRNVDPDAPDWTNAGSLVDKAYQDGYAEGLRQCREGH